LDNIMSKFDPDKPVAPGNYDPEIAREELKELFDCKFDPDKPVGPNNYDPEIAREELKELFDFGVAHGLTRDECADRLARLTIREFVKIGIFEEVEPDLFRAVRGAYATEEALMNAAMEASSRAEDAFKLWCVTSAGSA
jgi:hypothetical protein